MGKVKVKEMCKTLRVDIEKWFGKKALINSQWTDCKL